MADEKPTQTGGGAVFLGAVTAGRDLVGRDQTNFYSQSDQVFQALSPIRQVAEQASPEHRQEAIAEAEKIQSEVKKGKDANDSVLGKLIDGFGDVVLKVGFEKTDWLAVIVFRS